MTELSHSHWYRRKASLSGNETITGCKVVWKWSFVFIVAARTIIRFYISGILGLARFLRFLCRRLRSSSTRIDSPNTILSMSIYFPRTFIFLIVLSKTYWNTLLRWKSTKKICSILSSAVDQNWNFRLASYIMYEPKTLKPVALSSAKELNITARLKAS